MCHQNSRKRQQRKNEILNKNIGNKYCLKIPLYGTRYKCINSRNAVRSEHLKRIKQNKNNYTSHIKSKLLKTKDKGNNIGWYISTEFLATESPYIYTLIDSDVAEGSEQIFLSCPVYSRLYILYLFLISKRI